MATAPAENLTDTAIKVLKTVIKSRNSTTTEKINAAGKLAMIESRSDKTTTNSGIDRMDRAQIQAELRRCQVLLGTNGL